MLATRRSGLVAACCTVAMLGVLAPSASEAAGAPVTRPLTANEREALASGERVERPLRFATSAGRYVGGISYQIVRARPEQVLAALQDVDALPQLLPRTEEARLVGFEAGRARIRLTQGSSLFTASYAIQLERTERENELRFWMDAREPSDIRDVWGFFRAEPHGEGKTLLTVGVALDLGPGIARALFEDRVQRLMLGSVTQIRDFVEPRRLAEVDR